MDNILICENCEYRYIKMIEHNGDLMARGIGEIYTGTITLGLIDNKDDRSLKKSCKKITEEFLLLGSNKELCCFKFSKSELERGEKVIKVQVQSDPSFVHHILICYSSSTYSGTSFLLPNFEELKRWAEELNIYTYETLDSEGELISVEHFEE